MNYSGGINEIANRPFYKVDKMKILVKIKLKGKFVLLIVLIRSVATLVFY